MKDTELENDFADIHRKEVHYVSPKKFLLGLAVLYGVVVLGTVLIGHIVGLI